MYEVSLIRSINIYLVENLSHSLVSLGLVTAVLALFGIRQPALRIRFFFLSIIIPFIASPIYYLISPNRFSLPVIKVDSWLNIEALLNPSGQWMVISRILTLSILAVGAVLLLKGVVSLIAMFYLPRRYTRLSPAQNPHLHLILNSVLSKASFKRPVVLLSQEPAIVCCAFGLRQPYLLISQGALEQLSPSELEAVVAHEMGHLQRWDGWLGFLVLTFRNILFFNPVVYFLCQRILRDAELAADELAVAFGPSRLEYAESLVRVSRSWVGGPQGSHLATSHFFHSQASLKARLLHALEETPQRRTTRDNWLLVGTAATLIVGLFFIC